MKLVDASIALKWFLPEPDAEQALGLLANHELCAPSLILSEVSNGLWKNWRKDVLTAAAVHRAVAPLAAQFTDLSDVRQLVKRAAELSISLMHPVYDCIYLADAERRGLPLVTADKRLLANIAPSSLSSLVVHLRDHENGGNVT